MNVTWISPTQIIGVQPHKLLTRKKKVIQHLSPFINYSRLPHMCQFYNKYSTYSCVSYWLHLYLLSLDQQAGLYSVILTTNIDVLAFCVFAITKIKCREISPFKTHEINCRWIFSFELDNKSWVWSYLKTNGTQ